MLLFLGYNTIFQVLSNIKDFKGCVLDKKIEKPTLKQCNDAKKL